MYTAFFVIEVILIGVGVLIIMEGSNKIDFTHKLPLNLARLSETELYITGGILIGFALIFLIIIICLWSKLQLGVKVVETTAIFVSERFYMTFMPILSAIFLFGTLAALLAGGVYLYGTGPKYFF